jgi:hypothetical protein
MKHTDAHNPRGHLASALRKLQGHRMAAAVGIMMAAMVAATLLMS